MSKRFDSFVRDHMPDAHSQPDLLEVPGRAYPARLNVVEELLDCWIARGYGARPALMSPSEKWTYDELFLRVTRYSAVLRHRIGVIPGNRVLLRGRNSPMLAALHLAVVRAGGVVVSTMPLLRKNELVAIINKAEISHAICEGDLLGELEACRSKCRSLRSITSYRTYSGPVELGSRDIDAFAATETRFADPYRSRSDTPCLIAFTSGTTGKPKGAIHTHRDLLAICDTFSEHILQPTSDDLFCGSPSLAFTYGLGGLLLFPLRAGACSLLLEDGRPASLMQAIETYRPSICFTAPTAYRTMLESINDFDIRSLRKCVSAGETLPRSTFDEFRVATGLKLIDGIGSTEMLHVFISAAGDQIRPGSTGKAVPGYLATILDDDGNEAPPGNVGWLAVKGPTGCRYLGDDRQSAYVKNGWNITGDAYSRDEDGYFWYQSRMDDLIVSAGYKVAAPEVEGALLEHPAVAECAVVGVPCRDRGQRVKAYIVLRTGLKKSDSLSVALIDHVKTMIAPYKAPREVVFVKDLPKTLTGKLKRFALRVQHAA
jgi:2-aminobenzoate-CoA ligase